ncbi:MAG: 50S ribosomal protein L10 [SAR324 cluster bacterium]|nr:50S ribosomal protein L10 [SAR324 cluster bacterium]
MDRSTKEAVVADLKDLFNNASSAVLVDSKGLSVNKLVELRKELNQNDSKMRIIKNTLAIRASEGTPFEGMKDQFEGTRALVFSLENVIGPAKIISEFAKTNAALQIKMGILSSEGNVSLLSADDVQALANLPSREELIAKLLFVLNGPLTMLVRTLNEVPAKFVRTLSAVADSKNND